MAASTSALSSEESPPSIHVRWFQVEVPDLLSIAPIVLNSTITWRPLTRKESDACEAAWRKLPSKPTPSPAILSRTSSSSVTNGGPEIPDTPSAPLLPTDETEGEDVIGVPIEREQLFEVDVRTMTLKPVYWQTSGPKIQVMRSMWMFDETKPLDLVLSTRIEEAYMSIKPWQSSYTQELAATREYGLEAQKKLAYPLADTEYLIIFEQDGLSARLIAPNSIVSRGLSSVFTFGAVRPSPYDAGAPGVTMVYRGWDEAFSRSRATTSSATNPTSKTNNSKQLGPEGESMPLPMGDGITAPGPAIPENPRTHLRTDAPASSIPMGRESSASFAADADGEYTDLILCVHGIGQGLTAQYEAWDFVYATNMFRNVCRKQAHSPALSSIVRNRRVQFLPVQWRTSMKFDFDEEAQSQGHDNHFTLSEVTPKGTIAYVRELTNSVLTDIPLYMSHHRGRMIESVCEQANRTYRLWCARNPNFEKHGRVHIIAHSLGTALIAHILSNQPTVVPPLSQLSTDPKEMREMNRSRFLFNTCNVFNVGSPLSIFLRIQEVGLIARKGRERTMQSPDDEAIDRVGLFGCLAVDSIYNIFYPADPIAYLLNPTVDSTRAKEMQPTAIPNVTAAVLAPLRSGFGRFVQSFSSPFSSSPSISSSKPKKNMKRQSRILNGNNAAARLNPDPPTAENGTDAGMGMGMSGPGSLSRSGTGEGLEMFDNGKDHLALEGTKAERRFLALNPHGTLDYYLSGEGNISEYLDMLYAHSAYWNDASFASFIQTEIFASKIDLIRTSIGAGAF